MKRRNCAIALALIASQAVWADLTIRYRFEVNFGSALPGAATDIVKQQIAGMFPGEIATRVKGNKCASSFGPINAIIDNGKGEITLFNPASKQFSSVPAAEYMDRLLAQQQIPPAAMQSMQSLFQSLKIDVQTKQTGQTAAIQGLQAEENLVVLSIEMPNPGVPISFRVEMHQWLVAASELNRVPALNEVAVCSSALGATTDPTAIVQKLLGQFPGAADKLSDAVKQLTKTKGALSLKTQVEIFAPAILAMMQAQGGPGVAANLDLNAPLVEMDFNVSGISPEPLPDSVFQVPDGYQAAPLEDLLKAVGSNGLAQAQPSSPAAERPGYIGPTLRPGNGVSAPVPIYKPEPKYTEEARRAKIQGSVLVSMVVDADGVTRNLRVVRSLDLGLDQMALDAVREWKFKPGEKDGSPVAIAAQVEVTFRMLDKTSDVQ